MRKLSLSLSLFLLLLAGCFKAGFSEGPGCPGEEEFGPAGTIMNPYVVTMAEMVVDRSLTTEELVAEMNLALMEKSPIMIPLETEEVWVVPVMDVFAPIYEHLHTDGPCPEACNDILVGYEYVGSVPLGIDEICPAEPDEKPLRGWL
jgi:hypothetical protein